MAAAGKDDRYEGTSDDELIGVLSAGRQYTTEPTRYPI